MQEEDKKPLAERPEAVGRSERAYREWSNDVTARFNLLRTFLPEVPEADRKFLDECASRIQCPDATAAERQPYHAAMSQNPFFTPWDALNALESAEELLEASVPAVMDGDHEDAGECRRVAAFWATDALKSVLEHIDAADDSLEGVRRAAVSVGLDAIQGILWHPALPDDHRT